MCLETSAFGSGKDLAQAIAGLGKTLEGQYEELFRHGNDNLVMHHPDPEWVQAYKERKHPAIDRIKILFCGRTVFSITLISGRAKTEIRSAIDIDPSLPETLLQTA